MTSADPIVGTFVFTDLVGFTEYTDARGDAAALTVIDHQLAIAREVLAATGDGRLVKELGDGLMMWFETAAAGITAATSLRGRLVDARRDGFPLAIRIGVHAGEAIRRGDDLIGHAVNVASRIADTAGPGEILLSDEAKRAAHPLPVEPTPIGAVYVKGVADPVWLWQT